MDCARRQAERCATPSLRAPCHESCDSVASVLPTGGLTVDIVLTWVNECDEAWREARSFAYRAQFGRSMDEDSQRLRDWGLLRYWFRAVESFMPWIRAVHFVTEGALPEWLDPRHPKLHVVDGRSLLDTATPNFNSHAYEAVIDRIPGLAERFIYFNDDFFPLRPLASGFYFRGGLPHAYPYPTYLVDDAVHFHAMLRAVGVINAHFDSRKVKSATVRRALRPGLAKEGIRLLGLAGSRRIAPVADMHLPTPLLLSSVKAAYAAAAPILEQTRKRPFRSREDIAPIYLATMWQVASGRYWAVSRSRLGAFVDLADHTVGDIEAQLRNRAPAQLCINDGDVEHPAEVRSRLIAAFQTKLPEPSSFERTLP